MSFDSSRKKQESTAPARSTAQAGKRSSARAKRALRATIEEYILDHRSQNHSPKTIEWHTLALGNFAAFLEKQGMTFVEDIERVHVLSWLANMRMESGAKGKRLSERSVNCYARSMRAYCNWLEAEGYVQVAPSNHVKMAKVSRPLIRIIEFEEFERMLKACASPHETGPVTDINAARNRAILWVLWDTVSAWPNCVICAWRTSTATRVLSSCMAKETRNGVSRWAAMRSARCCSTLTAIARTVIGLYLVG